MLSFIPFFPSFFTLFSSASVSLFLLLPYVSWCPTMHPGNVGEEDRRSAICSVGPSRRQQTDGGDPAVLCGSLKGYTHRNAQFHSFLKGSPNLGVTHLLKCKTKLSYRYLRAFVPTHAQKLASPLAATSAEKKHNIKGSVMHKSPTPPHPTSISVTNSFLNCHGLSDFSVAVHCAQHAPVTF